MSTPLRVLIVEDSESDAAMVVRFLRKADYDVSDERVETAEQLRSALKQQDWDVVISDYRLPQFDAPAALALVQETGKDVPFIVVSGTIGEDTAVAMMRAGAHDYLMKDNLARLAPAVEREIREAHTRRERKRAEETLAAERALLRAIIDILPALVYAKDAACRKILANSVDLKYMGASTEAEALGKTDFDFYPEDMAARFYARDQAIIQTGQPLIDYEHTIVMADGQQRWLVSSKVPLRDNTGQVIGLVGVGQDITERKRAEEALAWEQDLLNNLITTIPDHIYFKDRLSRFTKINRQMAHWFALSDPNDALGKTDRDFFSEEHARQAYADEQRIMATGEPLVGLEEKETWPDGRVTWVSTTKAPIRNAAGQIEGIVGISRDITEHKLAEDAARKSEAQLSAALKLAHLGHWEYDVSKDLFTFNDHFYALLRTTAEREGGYTMSSDRYARRFIPPDDYAVVGRETRKAVETTDPSYTAELEHRVIFGDGQLGHMAVRIFIVKDSQGRTVRTYGVNQDVTERARSEEALKQSEEKFRTVFNSVTDGILLADLVTQRFLMANDTMCRMLGYSQEELLALSVKDIHPVDDLPMVNEAYEKQARREVPIASLPVKRKDGTVFPAEVTASPILLMGQDYMIGCFRDMTEKQELEEQLRQAQKMEAIGRLAGGVAHDFNNLLGIISGYAEITKQTLSSQHPARQRIDQLLVAVDRAGGLTRQLLAFSRKQIVQRQVVGLNGLVSEVQRMLARVIGEDVELRVEAYAERDAVRVDPGQIEQVLLNLAVNARDAMTRGGVLTIVTRDEEIGGDQAMWGIPIRPGPYCVLDVQDTGCGMSEETKARIFEPFFTTKPAGKGTGLGLATVYGIVRQSDGYVNVDSAPGKGTTFRIYLPLCEEGPEADVEERPAPENLRGTGCVLIVEDEEALREILAENLRDYGYTVLTAAHGDEALERARKGETDVDLLLTDVVMPLMGGRELADRMAQIVPGLRVMFMSGYSDNSVVMQDLVERGVPFLEKPFTSRVLARRVREAMNAPPTRATLTDSGCGS